MGAIPLVTTDDVVRILSDGKQQHFAFQATITADQHQLLQSLNGPCHTDDLARSLKQPIAAINALLARLEMNGLVIAQGAQTYIRAPCAEPLLD
jgi:predicted Rossmann fold nucleotide-binding protein DprA/Smf involved in DNA uptake